MELYFLLILSTAVFAFAAPGVKDKICGDPDKEASDCKYDCRKRCLEVANQLNLKNKTHVADLKLKVNLCVCKCAGKQFNPRLLLANLTKVEKGLTDPNWQWTSFADIQNCLGPCAYPTPDQCLKGYLSAFLYCDCDSCCKDIGDRVKSQLCIVGCHDWFLRQWSPKINQSCRFPAGYLETPDAWCEGLCLWQMLKKSIATMSSLNISTPVGQNCMKTCKDRIGQNERVDYNTIDSLCADPWKCLTIQVNGFQITTLLNDNTIIDSHRKTNNIVFGSEKLESGKDGSLSQTFTPHKKCQVEYKDHTFPPAYQGIPKDGIHTGVEPGAQNNVKVPKDPFGFLPKPVVGTMIAHFYDGDINQNFGQVDSKMTLTQTDCTNSVWEVYCNQITNLKLEYDVILKISESSALVPTLSADQIKSLVAKKYSALTYEGGEKYYVLYKATGGKITVTYNDIPKATLKSCLPKPGCKGGPDKPKCNCEGKSCP